LEILKGVVLLAVQDLDEIIILKWISPLENPALGVLVAEGVNY
jgi:hypothetical protein